MAWTSLPDLHPKDSDSLRSSTSAKRIFCYARQGCAITACCNTLQGAMPFQEVQVLSSQRHHNKLGFRLRAGPGQLQKVSILRPQSFIKPWAHEEMPSNCHHPSWRDAPGGVSKPFFMYLRLCDLCIVSEMELHHEITEARWRAKA